jgi:hypothetical protein
METKELVRKMVVTWHGMYDLKQNNDYFYAGRMMMYGLLSALGFNPENTYAIDTGMLLAESDEVIIEILTA